MDEHELIQRAASGDVSAFERLVSKHQDKIYSFAAALCGNDEDAKDIAQISLLKAFVSIRGFRGTSNFTTWLYRILCNTFKDELKKRQRRRETDFPDDDREMDEMALAAKQEKIFHEKETRSLVYKCLREMPKEFSYVILLRDLQDFDYQEISEILNIPLGTVKSRLARARDELRKILARELLRG